jgi:hypothetical protein
MTPDVQKPLKIFCSYSHRDEEHLDDLRDWLRGLERQGMIEWWHDREISPGWEWEEAIDKSLRSADVILLLVSPAFMASDYVYEQEMDKAVGRHDRSEARVIPIIVRPADWEWASFGKLQALPKDARPITRWPDRDEAWLDVLRGVRKAVGELLVERQERAVKERYRKAVEQVWADNKISGTEAERLDTLTSELGLAMETAADIEREVMGEPKEAILERQEEAAREKEEIERRKRLDERYTEARGLHDSRNWQGVADLFEQIHTEDPTYRDREGLLASAREALKAQEVAITGANADRIQCLRTLRTHAWRVQSVEFSPDGRLLASASTNKTLLWGVEDGQLRRTLVGHTRAVSSVRFSPDGRLLASGSEDETVRLWQVEDGQLRRTLEGHMDDYAVNSVGFSPDGRLLASGSEDETVRLWQVEDGQLRRTLEGHMDAVNSVGFSPDGRLLASGSEDETVRLWQVEDGKLLHTLQGGMAPVFSVAFSPNGELLASGSDEKIRLWRVEDGEVLRILQGHTDWVFSVAFSPNGQLLASGSQDKTVRLWSMR